MKPNLNELRKQLGNWGAVLAFRTAEAKERHGSRIVIRIISPDEWRKILEIWQKDDFSAPKKVVKYLFRDEAGIRRVALNERIAWAVDYEAVRKEASEWGDILIRNRRPAKIAYPSLWSRGIGAEVEPTASSAVSSSEQLPTKSMVVDHSDSNQSERLNDNSDAVIQAKKKTSPTLDSSPLTSPHVFPTSQSATLNQLKPTEKKQQDFLLKYELVDAWAQLLKRRMRL